jgi:head-tail adaptor
VLESLQESEVLSMANIGGNIAGVLQLKENAGNNEFGENVSSWTSKGVFFGWLGMQSGDSKYTHNARIEESTHVFLCDYNAELYAMAENGAEKRMIIKNAVFSVQHIDNPDELNEQLEIYLRKIGAWNGDKVS